MKRAAAMAMAGLLFCALALDPAASGYLVQTTVPQAGGCPQLDRWNLSPAAPLNRRWSTSLPLAPATILTVAASGTSAQLAEIGQAISDSFGAWTGVTGTTLNATSLSRA